MGEIDVSNCKFYEFDGICGSPINKNELECNKITNEMCYYKQLQQLKSENEFKESQINDWIKQYKLAHQKYMKLQTKNEKYKQCLDEIEEIVKNSLDACHACNSANSCMRCDKGEILQKIKEANGNR